MIEKFSIFTSEFRGTVTKRRHYEEKLHKENIKGKRKNEQQIKHHKQIIKSKHKN